MTSPTNHVDVAAYVLGILDEDEVDAFENHLAQCRRCALDLRDFAVLPDLLDEADANGMLRANAGERPDGRSVRAMLDEVSVARSKKRRLVLLVAAAAAVLLVAGTAFVSSALSPSGSGTTAQSGTTTIRPPSQVGKASPDVSGSISRVDPDTDVAAKVSAVPEEWGTSLEFEVKGVKGPVRCEVVVKSRSGETTGLGGWTATQSGAAGTPVTIRASTGLKWSEIGEFSVRDEKGATLVRLPVA
ncbi:zf-HC2 domain-containing protein [Actinosynnema sp. NPDC020468]|uniref:anti-sigma factor family protein n=1 Tax=Actinosynnema sp. NPDC020468 TaxID=3154488 RepID=UPI0033C5F7E0